MSGWVESVLLLLKSWEDFVVDSWRGSGLHHCCILTLGWMTRTRPLVPEPRLIRFSVALPLRDESEAYLAGLGTVGMEVLEQVPKLDAVVVPAAGQYGLLASTAAAIKHLNSRVLVIVSMFTLHCFGASQRAVCVSHKCVQQNTPLKVSNFFFFQSYFTACKSTFNPSG